LYKNILSSTTFLLHLLIFSIHATVSVHVCFLLGARSSANNSVTGNSAHQGPAAVNLSDNPNGHQGRCCSKRLRMGPQPVSSFPPTMNFPMSSRFPFVYNFVLVSEQRFI
ncbi:hypothetical protein ANCCAN_27910, partial [Ancylostoma caninum]